jgi:hypothetical protein
MAHARDLRSLLSGPLLAALLLPACSAPPAPPARAEGPTSLASAPPAATQAAQPAPPADLRVDDQDLEERPPWSQIDPFEYPLPREPAGLEEPCTLPPSPRAIRAPACADRPSALVALDAALATKKPADRQAALAALETCAGLPPGLIRAFRAEQSACPAALVEPLLASPPANLPGEIHVALLGHAIAGRARRARFVLDPVKSASEADVDAYVRNELYDQREKRSVPLAIVEAQGLTLPPSYGRALALLEVGKAWWTAAGSAIAAPLPKDLLTKEAEPRRRMLEEGRAKLIAPLRERSRKLLLQAFRDLDAVGVIDGRRVSMFRAALLANSGSPAVAALFADDWVPLDGTKPDGTPVRSLQRFGVLLPDPGAPPANSPEERLAAALPTFYAGHLLDPARAREPGMLRALLQNGLPFPHRKALLAEGLPEETVRLHAHGRLLLGLQWMDARQFERAALLLAALPPGPGADDARALLLGLAKALRRGPPDAEAWLSPARLPQAFGDVTELEALVSAAPPGPLASFALFDATKLRGFAAAPQGQEGFRVFLLEQAARYRKAAGGLPPWAAAIAENEAVAASKAAQAR